VLDTVYARPCQWVSKISVPVTPEAVSQKAGIGRAYL